MFKNYLITAIRHIMRNKFVSAINIMSLSIGLAAALLVMLFVQHELSYDQWIPDAQDIYRYEIEITDPGGPSTFIPFSPQQTSEPLLSEEKALKYFGDRSPLGETISVEVLDGGDKADRKN